MGNCYQDELNRLTFKFDFDELLKMIQQKDYDILPVTEDYLKTYLSLPLIHGDPFDRILIATAITEEMTFITSDDKIQKYDFDWMWK